MQLTWVNSENLKLRCELGFWLKNETWEAKTGPVHIHACLFCSMVTENNKLAWQWGHYWYRQHQHLHRCSIRPPPIRPVAPANSLILTSDWYSWVRVQASWGWQGFSYPSMPSHHASRPCQPSLGETVKTFPFKGVLWCSLEQSIPKTSSVELPFSHGQSLPGQERSAGGPPPYEASVSSGSFLN